MVGAEAEVEVDEMVEEEHKAVEEAEEAVVEDILKPVG